MPKSNSSVDEIRRRVREAERLRDEARGALSALKATLKSEFGVSSLKEAKKLLSDLEEQLERANDEVHAAERKLEKEWVYDFGPDSQDAKTHRPPKTN